MKSLAEHLGISRPVPSDPGARSDVKRVSVKAFCQGIIESPEYRAALMAQIMIGDLPPAVHTLLYHYAYGKPVEHVKIEDVTQPLEDTPLDKIEARAAFLAEVAKKLREREEAAAVDAEDQMRRQEHEGHKHDSVH